MPDVATLGDSFARYPGERRAVTVNEVQLYDGARMEQALAQQNSVVSKVIADTLAAPQRKYDVSGDDARMSALTEADGTFWRAFLGYDAPAAEVLAVDVPVTPEPDSIEETTMLLVGHNTLAALIGHSLSSFALMAACRAMHAVAPIELVSQGERQAVRERDSWRRVAERLENEKSALSDEIGHLHDLLRDRTDRMHAALAKVGTPEPEKPNPFRGFPSDPRRMGP